MMFRTRIEHQPYVGTPGTFYGELRPLTGEERSDPGRDIVVTRFRLFAPPTVTLTSQDTVTAFDRVYGVVSEPEPHNVGGRVHHYEVLVERHTG